MSDNLKCVICDRWGAVDAGDTWCDHCEDCHERYFVWVEGWGYCYSEPRELDSTNGKA